MILPRMKKTMMDDPKKLAGLIDLVNLPTPIRDFMDQSRTSRLGCFMRVWSYIKDNNLQVHQFLTAYLIAWFSNALNIRFQLVIYIYFPCVHRIRRTRTWLIAMQSWGQSFWESLGLSWLSFPIWSSFISPRHPPKLACLVILLSSIFTRGFIFYSIFLTGLYPSSVSGFIWLSHAVSCGTIEHVNYFLIPKQQYW